MAEVRQHNVILMADVRQHGAVIGRNLDSHSTGNPLSVEMLTGICTTSTATQTCRAQRFFLALRLLDLRMFLRAEQDMYGYSVPIHSASLTMRNVRVFWLP